MLDQQKAKPKVGWKPNITFEALATLMAEADWEAAKAEKLSKILKS